MKMYIIYKKYHEDKLNMGPSWMKEEAERVGFNAELLFSEYFSVYVDNNSQKILYKNKVLALPDVVYFRCYNIKLAKQFEELGVKVFNSSNSMDLSRDKWNTHLELSKYNISQPKTYKFFNKDVTYDDVKEKLGKAFIAKESNSSQGQAVFLIKNKTEFNSLMLNCNFEHLLFQEFIEESSGKDLRVYVINKKVVGVINRFSETDFRSNLALGGKFKEVALNEKIENIAITSTIAVGLDFAGIDLLIKNNDYLVCEVNGNAGYKTFYHCGYSIPKIIMEYIMSRIGKDRI